jgi:hypothetical protein
VDDADDAAAPPTISALGGSGAAADALEAPPAAVCASSCFCTSYSR